MKEEDAIVARTVATLAFVAVLLWVMHAALPVLH